MKLVYLSVFTSVSSSWNKWKRKITSKIVVDGNMELSLSNDYESPPGYRPISSTIRLDRNTNAIRKAECLLAWISWNIEIRVVQIIFAPCTSNSKVVQVRHEDQRPWSACIFFRLQYLGLYYACVQNSSHIVVK